MNEFFSSWNTETWLIIANVCGLDSGGVLVAFVLNERPEISDTETSIDSSWIRRFFGAGRYFVVRFLFSEVRNSLSSLTLLTSSANSVIRLFRSSSNEA
ncbi:hypothetical protein OGAPHI_007268 [Ogataea philodendri]|uniref:Uncharacterized protein n=1 Tax=Ogataea philodendri TaxID=1378263 RepID=A0A9P8SYU8_9ASCO|nr:uncharacterized protein OGAPHI_007268 [Ogataea philodendri]KAH3660063.1 hypothetical protein OGAPHI_007268 [Ogataea philodendri]